MPSNDNKLVALCLEQSAKRCALLFEYVTVATQWSRGHRFHDELERTKPNFLSIIAVADKEHPETPTEFSNQFMWQLATVSSGRGYECVPIYESATVLKYEFELERLEHKIQRLILDNMPMIDDADLTWEHIIDIRLNKEVIQKFSALRMWLRSLGTAVSASEFQDRLAERILQYQTALKTNGLKSISGALSLFVDPSKLATSVSLVAGSAVTLGAAAAAMTAGFLTAGNVAVKLTEYMIGKNQIRSDFGEVAILEDLKQLTIKK